MSITPASSASAALEVRIERSVHPGLTLRIKLTLDHERGVLFGSSGAGKTTLLRLIAGLASPETGSIVLGGRTLYDHEKGIDLPLRQRGIGFIFQDDLLFPHMNVSLNIKFGLGALPNRQSETRLSEVAALCEVEHLLDRMPSTLSGGERQRVGLARALAPRPKLLLCDEPVSALDLHSRRQIVERIRSIQIRERIPLLFVTHSPAEAIAIGEKLFLLQGGTLIDEGWPLEVLNRERTRGEFRIDDVQNFLRGTLAGASPDGGSSHVQLFDGPLIILPKIDLPEGSALTIQVRADDILLAVGAVEGLSARNLLSATVERVYSRGQGDAEVVVKTGGVAWIVSVTDDSVAALRLGPGSPVQLVIKARSCHVLESDNKSKPFPNSDQTARS